MRKATYVLKALANDRRQDIIHCLARHGSVSVTDLASEISVSFPAASKHLARLYAIGAIDFKRKGEEVHYHIKADRTQFLDQMFKLLKI